VKLLRLLQPNQAPWHDERLSLSRLLNL
jgi:hypothetical protein